MAKHSDTLRSLFIDPAPANIRWADAESLFRHHGAIITEGSGSRVRVALRGQRAVFHRPHPQKEIRKASVKDIRKFLVNAGVRP